MTNPNDKDADRPETTGVQPAGRVEFDSRGNSVWRWAKDVVDSTSILLKRLDNKDLALEPTRKVPVMGRKGDLQRGSGKADPRPGAKIDKERAGKRGELGLADAKGRKGAGGFDPYNSR